MAVLWQKHSKDTHYEVRQAGNSLRLYTNGIFHSQWNPKKPLSGHLWDLFILPAIALESQGKALVLGLGGGAAVNGLQHFCDFKSIEAVELDKQHIQIAERWFLNQSDAVEIHHDDARVYMKKCRKRYDYIVDDLFAGSPADKSDARRAVQVDKSWLAVLVKRLTKHGSVVLNLEDKSQANKVAKLAAAHSEIKLKVLCQSPRYENAVVLLSKREMSVAQFRKATSICQVREFEAIDKGFVYRTL